MDRWNSSNTHGLYIGSDKFKSIPSVATEKQWTSSQTIKSPSAVATAGCCLGGLGLEEEKYKKVVSYLTACLFCILWPLWK